MVREETREFQHTGRGHHYIADAAARSIREGKTEHELWSLDKSLFEMEVFDEVTGLIYISSTIWLMEICRSVARVATSFPPGLNA